MSNEIRRRLTNVDKTKSFDSVIVNDGSKLRQITKNQLEKIINIDGVVGEVSGTSIHVRDSAKAPFRGMKLFGKTTQLKTTGKNKLDVAEKLNFQTIFSKDISIPAGRYILSWSGRTYGGANKPYVHFATNDAWIELTANEGTSVLSFDKPEDHIYIYPNGSSASDSNGITATIERLMVSVDGGEYEPYSGGVASPSPEWKQDLVSPGDEGNIALNVYSKNFFKENAIPKKQTVNGITCEYEGNGIFHIYGTHTGTAQGMQISTTALNIPIDPDDYYTMSTLLISGKCPVDFHPYLGVGSDNVSLKNWFSCWLTPDVKEGTIVTHTARGKDALADANKIAKFWIYSYNNDLTNYTMDARIQVWIERGKESTKYEPFTLQELAVSTPSGLPGIPVTSGGNYVDADGQHWVCDEVDLERGVYIQRVRKLVISGGENWTESSSYQAYSLMLSPQSQTGMCTHLNKINADQLKEGETGVYLEWSGYAIVQVKELFPKLGDFLLFLSEQYDNGTPFTIYYCFETPIETPLTDEELAAYQVATTNHLNTTILNDAEAHMEVTYSVDLKTYIEDFKNAVVGIKTSVTLLADSWTVSDDGYYFTQEVTVPNTTVNSKIDLQPTPEQMIYLLQSEISLFVANNNGTIVVYALNAVPEEDMTFNAIRSEVIAV